LRIKGTSIASFLSFLEAEYGVSRTKAFVAGLEPNLKKRCEGLILASAYYPYTELESVALQAREHFGGDLNFLHRSGSHNAVVGLTGVYQALLARPTPVDFLRAAERAWGQFSDTGVVRVEVVNEGNTLVRIEGLPPSEVLCARQTGFFEKSLEMAHAKQLKVAKTRCNGKGADACEWTITWCPETSPRSQSHTQTSAIRRPVAI
jgi:hypothetical protein